MGYLTLILGVALLAVFYWLLRVNWKRSGLIHALFRVDTILGLIAGAYLIVVSMQAILIR
jgi:hypothetical protein